MPWSNLWHWQKFERFHYHVFETDNEFILGQLCYAEAWFLIQSGFFISFDTCEYHSKTAKLCLPPLFSIHGRFHGSEEGEIEAWHGHSWSESRDYISLYIYWVAANWYSFVETFKTKNGHSFWLYGPFFIILKLFES